MRSNENLRLGTGIFQNLGLHQSIGNHQISPLKALDGPEGQ